MDFIVGSRQSKELLFQINRLFSWRYENGFWFFIFSLYETEDMQEKTFKRNAEKVLTEHALRTSFTDFVTVTFH